MSGWTLFSTAVRGLLEVHSRVKRVYLSGAALVNLYVVNIINDNVVFLNYYSK